MFASLYRIRGYLMILTASLLWAMWMVAARGFVSDISPINLAHITAGISWICLAVMLGVTAPRQLLMRREDIWRFLLFGGIGFAFGSAMINYTVKLTNTSTAVVLQYLAPALTLAFDRFRRTEQVTARKLCAVAMSLTGCALIVGMLQGKLVFRPLGIMTGLTTAVTFSFNTIYSKSLCKPYKPLAFACHAFFATTLVFFFVHPWRELLEPFRDYRQGATLALAIIALSILPTVLFYWGVRSVSCTAANIICSAEIAFAGILAWYFRGESMVASQIIGAALVMAAVIMIEGSPKDVG